jgi:hypothetical protein
MKDLKIREKKIDKEHKVFEYQQEYSAIDNHIRKMAAFSQNQ